MSLGFSLGSEGLRAPAYLLSHIKIPALLLRAELRENGFNGASLTKDHIH